MSHSNPSAELKTSQFQFFVPSYKKSSPEFEDLEGGRKSIIDIKETICDDNLNNLDPQPIHHLHQPNRRLNASQHGYSKKDDASYKSHHKSLSQQGDFQQRKSIIQNNNAAISDSIKRNKQQAVSFSSMNLNSPASNTLSLDLPLIRPFLNSGHANPRSIISNKGNTLQIDLSNTANNSKQTLSSFINNSISNNNNNNSVSQHIHSLNNGQQQQQFLFYNSSDSNSLGSGNSSLLPSNIPSNPSSVHQILSNNLKNTQQDGLLLSPENTSIRTRVNLTAFQNFSNQLTSGNASQTTALTGAISNTSQSLAILAKLSQKPKINPVRQLLRQHNRAISQTDYEIKNQNNKLLSITQQQQQQQYNQLTQQSASQSVKSSPQRQENPVTIAQFLQDPRIWQNPQINQEIVSKQSQIYPNSREQTINNLTSLLQTNSSKIQNIKKSSESQSPLKQAKSIVEMNEEEKAQLHNLERNGIIKYLSSIFIDSEYMFKKEISNQLITIDDLLNDFKNQKDDSQINKPTNIATLNNLNLNAQSPGKITSNPNSLALQLTKIPSETQSQQQTSNLAPSQSQYIQIPKESPGITSAGQNSESKNISKDNQHTYFQFNTATLIQDTQNTNLKPEGIITIKRDIEKSLCEIVCKKQDRKQTSADYLTVQLSTCEQILISGLKRCLRQLNAQLRDSFCEMLCGVLVLQSKKHLLVEKKKRDASIGFIKELKDEEKVLNVELFGKEENVQNFRIKLAEILLENDKIKLNMEEIQGQNKTLNEFLQKQKKLNNMIKNEYLKMKHMNADLQRRLNQKIDSYSNRIKRQNGYYQQNEGEDTLNFSGQVNNSNNNNPGSHSNKSNSKYKLEGKDKTPKQHGKLREQASMNNRMDKILGNRSKSLVSSSSSLEEECDIEELLRDAGAITKVENNEVMIKEINEQLPILFYNQDTQTDPKITQPAIETTSSYCQTDLQLTSSRFDKILSSTDMIEQLNKQEEIKDKLQNISEQGSEDSFEKKLNEDLNEEDENESLMELQDEKTLEEKAARLKMKEIEQKLDQRISVVSMLRGLPIEKRKKKLDKTDIEAFENNIHILRNFLRHQDSETSIILNDDAPELEQPDEVLSKQQTESKQNINIESLSNGKLKRQESRSFSQKNNLQSMKETVSFTNKINTQNTQSYDRISTPGGQNNPNNNIKRTQTKKWEGTQTQISQFGKKESNILPNLEGQKQNNNNTISVPKKIKGTTSEKNKEELKEQILAIVKLYNLEVEKCKNYEESIDQLIKILQELFNFCYKIFAHVQRTQKDTYKSIVESFYQTFTMIRWKLPQEIDQQLEEDLYPEETLKKKLEKRQKQQQQQQLNGKGGLIQRGMLFNTQKQANKLTVNDKSAHPGMVLTKKLREVGLPKKFNSFMPLKSVLKIITQIYEERARQVEENRLSRDTELQIFVFGRFIHQYGFKNVAEQKFLHFLMNVLHYAQIFRVNIFAKLIGLMQNDSENFSNDETDTYLSGWHFLVAGSKMGNAIPFAESDLKVHAHYLRALDLLKLKLEKVLPPEQIAELKQYAEASKEQNVGGKSVVDVDQFLHRVIQKYHMMLGTTQQSVKGAFLACDLDGNGTINLSEFSTLYRHIEPEKFSFPKVCKMFQQEADIIDSDSKCLSFEKFSSLCLKHRLFLDNAQRKFLQIYEKHEIEQQFNELKNNWPAEKQMISQQIDSLKPFVQPETFTVWKEVLLVLQERILQSNPQNAKNASNNNSQTQIPEDQNNPQASSKTLRNIQKQPQGSQKLIQGNNQSSSKENKPNLMPILIANKLLKQELKRLLDVGQTEDMNFNDSDLDSDGEGQTDEVNEESNNNNNDGKDKKNTNSTVTEIQPGTERDPIKKGLDNSIDIQSPKPGSAQQSSQDTSLIRISSGSNVSINIKAPIKKKNAASNFKKHTSFAPKS